MKTYIHFLIISSSVPLRAGNFSDKSCIEDQNKHFVLNNFFFPQKILPFMRQCGKIWKGRIGHR